MNDKYKRVSQDAVETWMLNPVTVALIDAMKESVKQCDENTLELTGIGDIEQIGLNALMLRAKRDVFKALSEVDKYLQAAGMIEESISNA